MRVLNILAVCLAMIEDESEQQKFEQIYWAYKDLMFYYAKEKVHDDYRAEEAVNTAFLHLAKNMNMVETVISPRTKRLMVTIVERTAINLYNKRQKEYNRIVSIEEMEHILVDFNDYAEENLSVTRAILKLPLLYRQPIILKFSQGYTTKEIAAILDYSVAKVEKLIGRGKKQLEKLLEEERAQ